MTDLHTARPPGGELEGEPASLKLEPEEPAEHDEGAEDGWAGAEDGSETAGPLEGKGGRRKGLPWTEAEHRDFLLGLQKLGKGDWRGISRHYVATRTPTQVASHAQKHFIRQQTLSKRKRRHSLFDITGEEEAQPASIDAAGVSHPQGVTTDAQSQQQQQQPQPQPGQPQQFMPQAMQHMPHQYPGAMPGAMPGYGYGGPMQAAAAAQGWNLNAGFMGQLQQFPNYFQMAQQQQAAAGAMFLAQQQHQQQQAAMAAFMQQHGYGAAAGFGPQGFGGQGFGFSAPGMVHMLPHYQQAMFSQPSVNMNASMQSSGAVNRAAMAPAQSNGGPAAEAFDCQPSQQQQTQQPLQRGTTAFASGQLASGVGSNAGSWLGIGSDNGNDNRNGSAHGSNQGSRSGRAHGSGQGSRHGSSPEGDANGSGSGGGSGGSGDRSDGDRSGDGSGSGTDAQTDARPQPRKQHAGQIPEQEPQQPPPEGHGAHAKAHTPFADAPEQAAGDFCHGRLYRPTASHASARPSHSLSALPLFALDDAAAGGGSDAGPGEDGPRPEPRIPFAVADAAPHNAPQTAAPHNAAPYNAAPNSAAPHTAPHGAFMRPMAPPLAANIKAQDEACGGKSGSGSGSSTADNGGRSGHGKSSGGSGSGKNSQRSSGIGYGGGCTPAQHSPRAPYTAANSAADMLPSGDGSKRTAAHSAGRDVAPKPPKRVRLGISPPTSAFEATPELATAAQQRRG